MTRTRIEPEKSGDIQHGSTAGRRLLRRLPRGMWIGMLVLILYVVIAILAPLFSTHDPLEQSIVNRLNGPSLSNWLGTDRLGRDVFSRLLYGARASLLTAASVSFVAVLFGATIGLISGYYKGAVDYTIQRIIDAVMAFPGILLAIGIMAFLGQGIVNIIVAITIVNIPRVARLVRGMVLQARELDYVHAARALGVKDGRLMARHLLPSTVGPVIVQATFILISAIRTEATLSFIGLGVPPPAPSWGSMLDVGKSYIYSAPMLTIAPGVAIATVILALSLIGDGLRDLFDPKS